MADPRFFTNVGPQSLGSLASAIGAVLAEEGDPETQVSDVAPLDEAGAGHISFLDNIKYKEAFARTKATACIVAPEMVEFAPKSVQLLITKTPYKAYALTAALFYPDETPASEISEKAHITADCRIGEGCTIEEGVVIRNGAEIGAGSWVGANSVIGKNVVIGEGCRIGANTTISHALIGDNVRIYPGCRIGQDGFGFAIDPAGHVKVPQLGRAVIEDNVEIGANTTIDRGAGPDTVVGRGTWIDNLVQIGHNVKIGKGCIIVSQAGVSGSTVIEDFVILAGQAGIAGHLRIGKGAQVGAQAGVMRDIPAGQQVLGSPALPKRDYMRQISALHRLVTKKSG